jgi:hypothetical protein
MIEAVRAKALFIKPRNRSRWGCLRSQESCHTTALFPCDQSERQPSE